MSRTQVVTAIIELNAFVDATENPSLNDFISLNFKSFKDHNVSDLSHFRESIVNAFKQVMAKLKPETEIDPQIDSLLLDEAFYKNKV